MKNIVYLLVLLILSSCSYFKSKALSSMSELMLDKSSNLTKESSFSFFKDTTPSNLKLIESFHFIAPKDKNFLTMLIKGHGGYGFSIFDTLALKDRLAEKEYSYNLEQAKVFYTKSLDFGAKFLALEGLKFEDLKSTKLSSLLDKHFDKNDSTALFYLAQSWGQLINASRDNLYLVAEIIYVEQMLNWICAKNPLFEEGVCDLYKAVFEAQKPRMMGGNPDVAEELFVLAMKRYPKNLLIKISYIEYILIPQSETAKYYRFKKVLANDFYKWRKVLDYTTRINSKLEYSSNDNTNLFNAVAWKRFNTIIKFEEDLF